MPNKENTDSQTFSKTVKELYLFYKQNLLKDNKKKFFILNGAMAASSILCGIGMPLASRWSINALTAAIGRGALGATYFGAITMERALKGLDGFVDTYIATAWDSFNFSTERPLALKKTQQAANIPEEAQKKPSVELSQSANQSASYATKLLNDTSALTFQIPYALSSAILATALDPAIGATALATCTLNGYLTYKNAKSNKQPNEEFRQTNKQYSARQVDVVQHYQRVKNLGREKEEIEQLEKLSRQANDVLDKRNRRFRLNRALQLALSTTAYIGIGIWSGVKAVQSGDIGMAMALMSASSAMMFSAGRITNMWGRMKENFDSWRNTEKDLQYDKSHDLTYGDVTPQKVQGKIEVKNVSYTYPAEPPKPALTGINLSLGNGVTVITGPSGSGKSTLLKLLQHTREGDGNILLDGVPLTQLPKGYLEQQIAIVNQRPDFFSHRTLKENLMSVSSLADSHSIRKALHRAALDGEISPDEYENKKMNELSGGQQQRENIAESFLQDKPIIIYDEPTANLDENNKRRIWHNLQRIAKDKTVIVVTHDVREIESADRIIYLKDGAIIQDGTPEELKRQKGPVLDLFKASQKPLKLDPQAIQWEEKQKLLKGLRSHKKRVIHKRLNQALIYKQLN
ncbi:MAG: ABC transporter ATP-binding protein [Alphaproteobacteria bacterium]|nr:ABC transporter ATP-binding protein [Alphaproteobacteria bacterium]